MKHANHAGLSICLACVLVMGAVSSSAALPSIPPGLVLWNKLGSEAEVLNSEFGTGFAI